MKGLLRVAAGGLAALTLGCGGDGPADPGGRPTGWQWVKVTAPLGVTNNEWVRVDPEDDATWYAGGQAGLFVTRDGGASWTRTLETQAQIAVEFKPGDSRTVYAASGLRVLRSTDRGATWQPLYTVPFGYVRSLHVGRALPGLILVGVQIEPVREQVPDRFYRSSDGGVTWTEQNIDGCSRGLIPWDIEEDVNGVLYAGTEIYDHPQPYSPPFWRSTDAGLTWQNVAAGLPWHVISIQAHPSAPTVFALTEGAGLYRTTDAAASWSRLTPSDMHPPSPELALRIDPGDPSRLYGGDVVYGAWPGGVWVSTDAGQSFHSAGLAGLTVGSLSLAAGGRTLVVAAYGSGIWRATVPETP